MDEDHKRYLIEARKQMAGQRRLMIKALASAYNRDQTEAHINMIVKFQNAIDIIDRVSQEERALHDTEADSLGGGRIRESAGSS